MYICILNISIKVDSFEVFKNGVAINLQKDF